MAIDVQGAEVARSIAALTSLQPRYQEDAAPHGKSETFVDESDYVLQREADVRAALGTVARLRVLAPAVPSAGVGALRVLRVKAAPEGDAPEIVAGYERYEPLFPGKRSA